MDFKLALSTLAVAVLLFASGAVIFAVLFKDYFGRELGHLFRPKKEFKLGGVILEKLVQGLLLSLLYRHMAPVSSTPLLNGLAFGALAGALMEATYLFTTWVNYRVRLAPVAVNASLGYVRMLVAGT